MRDVSYLIALFGAVFLFAATVAWWRIARKPDADPPSKKDDKRSNLAAIIVVGALLLSALAAVVAVLGWLQR